MLQSDRLKNLISPRHGFCTRRRERQKRRHDEGNSARKERLQPTDHSPVINRRGCFWEAVRDWQLKKNGDSNACQRHIERAGNLGVVLRKADHRRFQGGGWNR